MLEVVNDSIAFSLWYYMWMKHKYEQWKSWYILIKMPGLERLSSFPVEVNHILPITVFIHPSSWEGWRGFIRRMKHFISTNVAKPHRNVMEQLRIQKSFCFYSSVTKTNNKRKVPNEMPECSQNDSRDEKFPSSLLSCAGFSIANLKRTRFN